MLADYFAALAFAYIGMLTLCQGLERHYKQVWGKPPAARLRRVLRVAGWLSLGLSFWFCGLAWGWAMGPARDLDNAVCQANRSDAIASKPAPTGEKVVSA